MCIAEVFVLISERGGEGGGILIKLNLALIFFLLSYLLLKKRLIFPHYTVTHSSVRVHTRVFHEARCS